MNNKGQVLIMFVILIPLILLFVMYVVDIGLIYTEKNKLDSITYETISFSLNNINDNNLNDKISNIINLNDKDIKIEVLKINKNEINITLKKEVKAIFGNIIGKNKYEILSNYKGNINNKKIIKEF